MIVLLTGGCKNGKSNTAQDIACKLRTESGGGLYYVATMKSTGEEDDERIRKHVENREGLGFETIEISRDIKRIIAEKEHFLKNTFLVDSLTALLANEMFQTNENGEFFEDRSAPERVCEDIRFLCKDKNSDFIFVSDGIYSDAAVYDSGTESYRAGLALVEREVARVADEVIEMCAGKEIRHKNLHLREADLMIKDGCGVLIVGGAGQGKLEFAKCITGAFSREDVCIYDVKDAADKVPGGYKIYRHAERLARGTDKSAEELARLFPKEAVVICEDITCGIVPIDATDRKWRKDAGRLMQALSRGRKVFRVICGIGEEIG
ncbi:MAG: bifunctional adenosylcobinamide kinase/adenosylcobinamide-phosphate guanylyltransferase [Butyrivibrio sp.]|nr:bifunctional adenosylcobinamide kinase/adenosylcobinamide-phosphate guanylyltransferase [Butyrivibrio sp.]